MMVADVHETQFISTQVYLLGQQLYNLQTASMG